MSYRLRYEFFIDWIGSGMGPSGSPQGPGLGSSGNAQTLALYNTPGGQNITGTGSGGILATADITTLTNAAAADMSAQLNLAANLAKAQGFASGQP